MKQKSQNDALPYVLSVAFAFAGFNVTGCSSQEEPAPEVETAKGDEADADAQADEADTGGNALAAASNGQGAQGESEEAAPKEPIAADPYDDDWNNLGSQQQQKQQQVANKNGQQTEVGTQDEPPIQNTAQELPPEQQVQQQAPAEEPPLDMEPAPVAETVAEVPPLAPVTEVPPPPVTPVVSGAPLLRASDVEPTTAMLHWVGYDFAERDGVIRIEIVTQGNPKYNIFQERNQANQPELVVRFFNTALRDKVRRDIDASEFRSPVAYVRMRPDSEDLSVDVVMTMRDAVQPRMYTRGGNVMLTFPIPDHYFGNSMIGSAPVARAEVMPNANIMPDLDAASDVPEGVKIARAFINNPAAGAFSGVPADGGAPVEAPILPAGEGGELEPLPSDFSTEAPIEQAVNTSNVQALNSGDVDTIGDEGDLDFEGANEQGAEGANQFDNAGFDGEPAPAEQAEQFQGNFNESEEEPAEEQQGLDQGTDEELDDDSLEDFDDGEGESNEAIDKFDVRQRLDSERFGAAARLLAAGVKESSFTIFGVAQDDDFEEPAEQQATNQGNQANAQGNQAANQGTNQGQGQGQAQGQGANQFNQQETGEDDFGNGALNADDQGVDGEGGEANFPVPQQNTGNGNLLGEGGQGNVPAVDPAPEAPVNAGNFPAFGNSAPVNTTTDASLAPATQIAEPPLDGAPDLAGPESEGLETETPPVASAGGRPIKLDFRNAPLKDVIRVLSEESGVNFVVPGDVGDRQVHINLNGVPFNDALRALLETNQLGMVELGPNLVRIDTLQRLSEDKQAQENRMQAERRLKPTKILVHRLSYTKAEDAAKMLAQMLGGAASTDRRISVQTDVRTNAVIVNAPPNDLATVKALLERIDLETPQVKIASRIVEVLKTVSDSLGISWGGPLNFDQGRGLGFGNLVFPNNVLSRYSVDAGGTTNGVGNMQFQIGSINNATAIDLALSMEETRGTTDILQSSNLLVEDNRQANIKAGKTDFFQQTTSTGNGAETSLAPVEYNLEMTVTPHITADGAVQMSLDITSASPTAPSSRAAAAARSERTLKTSLLRRSGETAVIGGIYTTSRIKSESGLPGLSSLPIIGALFRSKSDNEEKRELIVMVTPTIVASQRGGDPGISDVALNSTQSLPNDLGGDQQAPEDFNLNGGQENQGDAVPINAESAGLQQQTQNQQQTQDQQQSQNQQQAQNQQQTQNQQATNQNVQQEQTVNQQQADGQEAAEEDFGEE